MFGFLLFLVLAYVILAAVSWVRGYALNGPMVLEYRTKDGPVWAVLAFLYRPFGDLYAYNTTVGNVCFLRNGITALPQPEQSHELLHAMQAARLGFGNVWVGLPAFAVLYFLLPLPVGLAYFRYRFELAAYLSQGAPDDFIIDQLSGRAYGWAWPKSLVTRALANRSKN